jgi:hypothetical protein
LYIVPYIWDPSCRSILNVTKAACDRKKRGHK